MTSRHQHDGSNDPVAATEQAFGPPQSGHVGAISGSLGDGSDGAGDMAVVGASYITPARWS